MSKIIEVIKNKNRVERVRKARRKEELANMRLNSVFRAKLKDEFRKIGAILEIGDVESVIIEVKDEFIGRFGGAIYTVDLAEFDIEQVEGEANQFYIRRKFITF